MTITPSSNLILDLKRWNEYMTMAAELGLHDWKSSGNNGSVGFDFIDFCSDTSEEC
jgi:hypothetical protein